MNGAYALPADDMARVSQNQIRLPPDPARQAVQERDVGALVEIAVMTGLAGLMEQAGASTGTYRPGNGGTSMTNRSVMGW
jgi:hypothetical protein